MVNVEQVERTFRKYYKHTGKLSIDPQTGLISCTGSVRSNWGYGDSRPTTLKVKFEKIRYDFNVGHGNLESLEGAPVWVGKNFSCSANKLRTLEGAPQHVGGSFGCSHNQLTSLEHSPQRLGESLDCSFNQLSSLRYCPQEVWNLFCMDNRLTSLNGAPTKIRHELRCWGNPLESLEGMPERLPLLWLDYSPTLPLLRCLNAKEIWQWIGWPVEVLNILRKYAGQGEASAFLCGAELAAAGYKENARW